MKDLIDEIIAEEFASPDLELTWLDEDEADPKGLEAVLEGRVKLGAVTLNEMRDALGLDPYTNSAADRPMVLTATGYVPIEARVEGGRPGGPAPEQPEPATQRDSLDKVYNPDEPRVPQHGLGAGEWTKEGAGEVANDAVRVVQNLPCDGYSGGCQYGGTYGTNAMYHMSGLNLCRECAVKFSGVENESSREQTRTLAPFQIQGK